MATCWNHLVGWREKGCSEVNRVKVRVRIRALCLSPPPPPEQICSLKIADLWQRERTEKERGREKKREGERGREVERFRGNEGERKRGRENNN